MSEQTVSPATPLAVATEVVEAILPGENGSATPDTTAVQRLMEQINVAESSTILYFGNQAQQQLTDIADSMLEGVKNKDVAGAGEALNEMVAVLRGFDVTTLDNQPPPSFFAKWLGKSKPAAKLLQQYEQVRQQIDMVTIKLERHKTKLLTDIALLDRLYRANLDYFHQLELYITAGDKKLHQLDSELIPQQEQQSQRSGALLSAQELRDLRGVRDELERRVHDLRLTRQVALQSLPSIRLVQENDKGLVNKISSTIVNTVPLWRQQLATAVTLQRTREAAATVKSATDLTNQLLEANAAALKHSNREARTEMERGLFDIESIKRANQMLIETIEESLRLADEGKLRRSQAVAELESCESRLKQSLIAASAPARAQP